MALLQADGIWTWYNDPRAVHDAARNCTYVGWLTADGTPWAGKYYHSSGIWHPRALRGVLEVDDHDNPALLLLDSAGSNPEKILAGYSVHTGNAYARLSKAKRGLASVDTESSALDASQSYCHLAQVGDNNKSVYWFFRDDGAATRPQNFRVSTNGGSTWGSAVNLYSITNERPYFKVIKNGSSRVDFAVSDGSPAELTTASTRHFYMTVAADGTRSYFKTDGTSISSALPLGTSDATLVYDGSTTGSWVWDICNVQGTLTILFTTFANSGADHTYWRAQWTGSAWATEQICNGGTSSPNYLYAAETYYSGGICADPYDTESVFVSRKYGAGDFRLEKWTKTAGTWAKSVDVSGNTSSVNARPTWVRDCPTTQILYWRGTYTSFTNYSTNIHSYPDMPVASAYDPIAKPASPSWQAANAPEGVLGYWPMTEGSGTTVANYAPGGTNGTFVGSPVWESGAYGPQIGSFSTTKYIAIDPASQLLAQGTYPFWVAVMAINSNTANSWLMSQGSSSSVTPVVSLLYNNGGVAGDAASFIRDDANTSVSVVASSQPINGEGYHVLMVVAWSASDHRLYLDGIQVQTGTDTLGTLTNNLLTLGALRRDTVTLPFTGSLAAAALGRGSAPDPGELAHEWLSGEFSAVRAAETGNRRRRVLIGAGR